jgi:hypothetical protein
MIKKFNCVHKLKQSVGPNFRSINYTSLLVKAKADVGKEIEVIVFQSTYLKYLKET